ncbi:Peregrin [Aphelenchoides besseyi]|nr:Peregrin [Aphelenchoides besseyi]
MGDAICEVHLNDNLYRLNTNAQLKIVSRKSKPKQKILRSVNEAIFKELPDKRRGSPLPKDYVQYNGKEAETDEEEVEYDIDDEDLVWLGLINVRREDDGLEPISNKLLELGIDRFEKASYFQNTDASKAHVIDNDAVCCICEDGDDSNVNQIIFCDSKSMVESFRLTKDPKI